MSGRIFVCITCDRYASHPGAITRGQGFATAVKATARARAGTTIRTVECLNNCRQPCAAALRAPGKPVVRFGNLGVDDIPALLDAADVHTATADAAAVLSALPTSLRAKVSGTVGANLTTGEGTIAA